MNIRNRETEVQLITGLIRLKQNIFDTQPCRPLAKFFVALSPPNEEKDKAKVADVIYRQDHRGVYRTRDGGDSWQLIENGLPSSELGDGHRCSFGFAIRMDPASGRIFLVPMENDSCRFPHAGRLEVYCSDDRGDSWRGLSTGLPENFYGNVLRGAMDLDSLDPCGVYFGSTSGMVYGSSDRGESWHELARSLPKILCVAAFEVQ